MYATKVREEMSKSSEDLANSEDAVLISNLKRQSLPAILPRRDYIRPCCQPRNVNNLLFYLTLKFETRSKLCKI